MATVVINNNQPVFTKIVEQVRFPSVTIDEPSRGVEINSVLPFRIRFTPIQITSLSQGVPAIPLQVIGFSNYIL